MDIFDPTNCMVTNLRTAARSLTRAYDAALSESNTLSTQFPLLSYLEYRSAASLSELSAYFSMDPSTVTRSIRPLIADEIVRMEPDSDDSRRKILRLTAKGRRQLKVATQQWRSRQRALADKFGEEDFIALLDLLKRLQSANDAE